MLGAPLLPVPFIGTATIGSPAAGASPFWWGHIIVFFGEMVVVRDQVAFELKFRSESWKAFKIPISSFSSGDQEATNQTVALRWLSPKSI